jgi:cytochrome c biogenesis factor
MTLDTNDEITSLKNQVFILLVALIVVSGTLTVVLYRQVSLANKDIAAAHAVSSQMYTNEVTLQTVLSRLVAYGERNPDYQAVLKKHGIGVPPGTAPAPARK